MSRTSRTCSLPYRLCRRAQKVPRVHLGCTSWRAGDANGLGQGADGSNSQTDGSTVETDGSRAQTDALNASNGAETAGISNSEGAGTDVDAGGAKRVVDTTDGLGSRTDAIKPENATEIVSIPRKRKKPPDSPSGAARRTPGDPNGCGNRTNASSRRTHASCVGIDAKTAVNAPEDIRKHRNDSKTKNSPNGREIAMPELLGRWRKVSIGGGEVYVPCNAPVEMLGTANGRIVFGRVESACVERVEAFAPSVEGERAGDVVGDGDNGDDGGVNGTTSGGDTDSLRVEAALLAAESQYTRCNPRSQRNDFTSVVKATHPTRGPSIRTRQASTATGKAQDRVNKRQQSATSRNDSPGARTRDATTRIRPEPCLWYR